MSLIMMITITTTVTMKMGMTKAITLVMLTMVIEMMIVFRSKWFEFGRIGYLFVNGRLRFFVCHTVNDLSTN